MDTNTQDRIYALEREVDTLNGVVGRLLRILYDIDNLTVSGRKHMIRSLYRTLPSVEDYEFLEQLREFDKDHALQLIEDREESPIV